MRSPRVFGRRELLLSSLVALSAPVLLPGCSSWTPWAVRSQSPEEGHAKKTPLVGDLTVPYGMHPIKVEGVGLVTGLRGTGSDPRPSGYRDALLSDMQKRGVRNPEAVLASPNTAMVLVRGILPPGIQKGDHFDIEVRIPSHDETTSLRGGFLLETRLTELRLLGDNQVHPGNDMAVAEGPLLVDPSANDKDNAVLLGRARILGGGSFTARQGRQLILALKPEDQGVRNSATIQEAVNRRFHSFEKGAKKGMAKAKEDDYVELAIHPRYKDNIQRYVQVIRATALHETESELLERLQRLEKELKDPVIASHAALQLEAIGRKGIDTLKRGIQSPDPEIRFYSAEALAYLDEAEAVEPLAEAARNQPAFRVFALAALSSMQNFAAAEQLHTLLDVNSAETRYGAFRALWTMNPSDPVIRGENLGRRFSYHVLKTQADPMVHVTRSRRPEIVLFGPDQRFAGQMALEAGNQIMITSTTPGEVSVAKFAAGEADQKRLVSDRVDDVIRAVVELGGTYPDVVQALEEAKVKGALPSRFEVDALPEAGRTYDRLSKAGETEPVAPRVRSPLPDLFSRNLGGVESFDSETEKAPSSTDSAEKPGPVKAFFARIMGRSSS